jgi:fused signal recognition particle receptor
MFGKKIADKLSGLFGRKVFDETFYEELEDILVEGDFGARAASDAVDKLKKEVSRQKPDSKEEAAAVFKKMLSGQLKAETLMPVGGRLNIFLVLGVNGTGKTTTIARLAKFYQKQGIHKIALAAGDTFRAGAVEQLKIHGARLGVRVVSQDQGSDSGAVIYDAIESALSRQDQLLIADTAGRMHNRENLVNELKKIDKIIRTKAVDANYKKILVIDSTTGQNAINQAEVFNEAVGLDSVVITKFDSGARGGAALALSAKLGLPLSFIGTGEGPDDLRPFDSDFFLDALLG